MLIHLMMCSYLLNHSCLLTLIHYLDVLVLAESLTLVDVDAQRCACLNESERLVLSDPLNDVLALVESLTLVDAESL